MSKRVAVVGLGAIGSQTLWSLARAEGVEVDGYEQFTIGHGFGAAGGDGRVFRTVQYEDPGYVPLIQRGEELWRQLEEETEQQLRVITGFLIVGTAGCRQLERGREGVDRYGLHVDELTPAQMRERFPFQEYHDDDLGMYDHDGGIIRPELTVQSAVRAAVVRGARVFERTPVLDIVETGSGVTLRTAAGDATYDQIVVATGAWAPKLAAAVSDGLIQPKKLTSAWYFPKRFGAFADVPPFLRAEPTQFYGVPSQDGLSVKLGLSGLHHEPVDSPDEADYTVRHSNLAGFVERVGTYFPELHEQPFRVETYFEGYTEDARPLIQKAAPDSRINYALGFSGHGFKLSPVYGSIAAGLALTGAADPDIAFLQRAFAA